MNIAHLLPYSARFPLSKHNGRYEWALRLARMQADNGHSVTIYAAPGSTDTNSKLAWKSSAENFGDKTLNNEANIKTALQHKSHDIYHSHFDYLHYMLADSTDKPLVFTQHWFPNRQIADAVRFNTKHNVLAVPGNDYMAKENQKLGIPSAKVIRQGIDLELFKPSGQPPGSRLIFVGRITANKGVLEAVQAARAANQPLDIVGKINPSDRGYWQTIEPLVDGRQIKYLGPKSQAETAVLLANAKALIFPSQAPEASPQVPLESQAAGTPVIISNVGASAEWIDDGKTGFIVKSKDGYVDAINNIQTIDRAACRRFAEQFDLQTMVNNYDKLYESLVK